MAARKGVTKEATKTVTPATSPSYPIHELMAESEALLGVKPEVFAGALEGAAKETLQVKEAKQLVEQFLRKKVL